MKLLTFIRHSSLVFVFLTINLNLLAPLVRLRLLCIRRTVVRNHVRIVRVCVIVTPLLRLITVAGCLVIRVMLCRLLAHVIMNGLGLRALLRLLIIHILLSAADLFFVFVLVLCS